jgi:WD40 repeat protein
VCCLCVLYVCVLYVLRSLTPLSPTSMQGKLIRILTGHGHWVNTMALSTDYALRTGAFDHHGHAPEDPEEARACAEERYLTAKGEGPERLVTGSDDHTMYLWHPTEHKKPIQRLTGHVGFSAVHPVVVVRDYVLRVSECMCFVHTLG